jgi:hypothetical protein
MEIPYEVQNSMIPYPSSLWRRAWPIDEEFGSQKAAIPEGAEKSRKPRIYLRLNV